MIRNLPPPPSRDRPNEFSGEMDAFLAALPDFVADANALEQSLQVVATTGTSTTTLTVGVGSKALTTQPGKAWATGAWVYIFAAAAVSNYMVGRVTSYNSATGALVVNVSAIDGSGTHASWVIGLATPVADAHLLARDGSRAMTAELLLAANAVNALGAVPKQQMDSAVSGLQALIAGRNRVINGTFSLNQRAFAGGSRTAGQYGHDRWKAGAGGATYTVSGETATITVGTLQQVIEGVNVPEGGTYTLSWSGTAQARVDGGSYAASPITVTGKTAGSNITIEFSTGSVTRVQFEAGAIATNFERRLHVHELAAAQRYYLAMTGRVINVAGVAGSAGQYNYAHVHLPVEMRAAPTVGYGITSNTNVSTAAPQDSTKWGCTLTITAAGAGQFAINFTALSFDAEL